MRPVYLMKIQCGMEGPLTVGPHPTRGTDWLAPRPSVSEANCATRCTPSGVCSASPRDASLVTTEHGGVGLTPAEPPATAVGKANMEHRDSARSTWLGARFGLQWMAHTNADTQGGHTRAHSNSTHRHTRTHSGVCHERAAASICAPPSVPCPHCGPRLPSVAFTPRNDTRNAHGNRSALVF